MKKVVRLLTEIQEASKAKDPSKVLKKALKGKSAAVKKEADSILTQVMTKEEDDDE